MVAERLTPKQKKDLPIQIVLRGIPATPAIESRIRTKAEKLFSHFWGITSCRVIAEVPPKHHRKGRQYNVHILISVPGGELVVKREPNEDFYLALRDAFLAAERQIKNFADRLRGKTKTHAAL